MSVEDEKTRSHQGVPARAIAAEGAIFFLITGENITLPEQRGIGTGWRINEYKLRLERSKYRAMPSRRDAPMWRTDAKKRAPVIF
jgi:hypothetical protein